MVDATRLPQALSSSRADRLKRPLDAAGVWLRISRSNGIAEFPVRRDELTEELAPVQEIAANALATAESRVSPDQVLAMLNSAFQNLFQEYPLTGGLEHREVDPIDNREYIYTVYPIETRYAGTFEELALVSNDAAETLLDVEYGVYKEYPGRIVLVFRDMSEGFPDGAAKIKLVGIPSLEPVVPSYGIQLQSVDGSTPSAATGTQLRASFPLLARDGSITYTLTPVINGTPQNANRIAFDPNILDGGNELVYSAAGYGSFALPAQIQLQVNSSTGETWTSQPITVNP